MGTPNPLSSALLDELNQYRQLLENIPAEIGVFDLEGRFVFNTPSGIKDPEVRKWVLGKTHHDYCRERRYPVEIADRRQAVIEECVREKRTVSFEEIWTDRMSRSRYYVRTFSPVVDAEGNVTHVIGYGQEITELKQVEDELRTALATVEELKDRLHDENQYLRSEIKDQHDFEEIIGESEALRSALNAIQAVASTEANVVITGETGTGKELVARAIHALGSRKNKPLIKVNCASIPRELFESEFFGHVKGAFTGAIKERVGRFQLAHQGTLFLDEVGEIPLTMQSKLLRVLQEGEYERVGDDRTRKVDVRIIVATNRDLKQEISDGRFRQDLYYRLNVFPIEVPPLRDRSGDIRLIAEHFLLQSARKLHRPVPKLTKADVKRIERYHWPGNIRELRNVIERAVITSRSGVLSFDLPDLHETGVSSRRDSHRMSHETRPDESAPIMTDAQMRQVERANFLAALRKSKGKIYGPGGAAELLDLKPTTLTYRLKKMEISRLDAAR